jgi:hypothetical protein
LVEFNVEAHYETELEVHIGFAQRSLAVKRTVLRSSRVVVSKDQVSSDLGGGEVAILNLKRGTYYGLDAVGARIWDLIQEPRTIGEIRDALVNEYEVQRDRCESDLITLLQRLTDEGLVEVRDETGA